MPVESFDRRLTPARPDLAAEHLRGQVAAERFVKGEPAQIAVPIVNILPKPDLNVSLDTQALFGERVWVYERKDGWAWVQLARDGYVGYAPESALGPAGDVPDLVISALRAPVFSRPDIKSPVLRMLPMNAAIRVVAQQDRFRQLADRGWIVSEHASAPGGAADWVSVAGSIVGAPYLWGGKTPDGLDCSGLVQTAMHAAGRECPRDADMQEQFFGPPLAAGTAPARGDLVFWKGHVGILRSRTELLHANAHHMGTVIEPFDEAVARITAAGQPIASIRRP